MEKQDNSPKKIVLEIKDLIIIILVMVLLWFHFNPMKNTKVSELDDDNKRKDKELNDIKIVRDSLKKEREKFDLKLDSLKKVTKIRRDSINFLAKESYRKLLEIKDLKEDLTFYNDMVARQSRKIAELEKNPIILPKNKLIEKSSESL